MTHRRTWQKAESRAADPALEPTESFVIRAPLAEPEAEDQVVEARLRNVSHITTLTAGVN